MPERAGAERGRPVPPSQRLAGWGAAALIVIGAAIAVGCSDSPTNKSPAPPAASPAQSPPPARTPRPEDSATPGPLPKAGEPATKQENPTGTGTGR